MDKTYNILRDSLVLLAGKSQALGLQAMKQPARILPDDLKLVFPDPEMPLKPHAPASLSWEEWMAECGARANAFFQTYDRQGDTTARAHVARFSLSGPPRQ